MSGGGTYSPFVGRADELERLRNVLSGSHRLVTLLGPGGIGKTRLSRQLLDLYRTRNRTGVFVDLSQAHSFNRVLVVIAEALAAAPIDADDGIAQIAALIRGRGELLLVLDNAEQIVDPLADVLAELLEMCPELRVVVTSRCPLQLGNEQRVTLGPLGREDARQLFISRARAVAGEFDPSRAEAAALERLLDRLEGFPLAIELAAARMNVVDLEELCERLAHRLQFLRGRSRHLPERHLTLAATISWSYENLSATGRELLAQCGVFRGGFTLRSVSAVAELSDPDVDIVDALEELVDHSLVLRERARGRVRFRIYGPIAEFALAKLGEGPERARATARHLHHFAELASRAADLEAAYGAMSPDVLARLAAEQDNMLAALERCGSERVEAAQLGLALANLAFYRGPSLDQSVLLKNAIVVARHADRPDLECRLLLTRAATVWLWGRTSAGAELELGRAREIAQRLEDATLEGRVRHFEAALAFRDREYQLAAEQLGVALELHERAGDRFCTGLSLLKLGMLARVVGRGLTASSELLERAIASFRTSGNRRGEALALRYLALAFANHGDYSTALPHAEDAVEIERKIGRGAHLARALRVCASIYLSNGKLGRASAMFDEVLAGIAAGIYPHQSIVDPYAERAWIHVLEGDLERANEVVARGLADFRRGGVCSVDELATLLCRGAVRLLAGAIEEARSDLRVVVWRSSLSSRRRILPLGLAGALLAVAEERAGHPERAWPAFAWAENACAGDEERRALAQLRGLFTGAVVRPIALAHREGGRMPGLVHVVASAIAVRLREDRPPGAVVAADEQSKERLRVESEGRWVESPEGERIDLTRRPKIRRLVSCLVESLNESPGHPVTPEALIERVWPGDRSRSSALQNRLWVAISTLRGLGIGDALKRQDEGYLLAPQSVQVV